MLSRVTIAKDAEGRYEELLDVVEQLARVYGSAANALAQMAMDSDLYKNAREAFLRKAAAQADANAIAPRGTQHGSTDEVESVPPNVNTKGKAVA